MQGNSYQKNTPAFRFQCWAAFLIAFLMTIGGIIFLEGDYWIKGYLAMGMLFTVGTCFTLAKTIRDDHEASQFVNRIQQAKTEKILSELEP